MDEQHATSRQRIERIHNELKIRNK